MKTFSERLIRLRGEAELSMVQLARLTGIDRSHLYALERGEKAPNWETVQKLALALQVSTEAFRSVAMAGRED